MKLTLLIFSLFLCLIGYPQAITGDQIIWQDMCEASSIPGCDWCGRSKRDGWTVHSGGNQQFGNMHPKNYVVQVTAGTPGNPTTARQGTKMYKFYMERRPDLFGDNGQLEGHELNWLRSELGWGNGCGEYTRMRWNVGSIWVPASHCVADPIPMEIWGDHKQGDAQGPASASLWMKNDRFVVQQMDHYPTPPPRSVDVQYTVPDHLGGIIPRGVWVDLVFERNYKDDASGYLRVYKKVQGSDAALVKIYEHFGPNYDMSCGPTSESYMMLGVYKWAWINDNNQGEGPGNACSNSPVTMFYDQYIYFRDDVTLAQVNAYLGGTSTPVNQPPTANAGPNVSINLPASTATFNGSASDDASTPTVAWTKVSGPAGGTITNGNTTTMTVTGLTNTGTYVYRMTATDNTALTAFDDVTLTVNPSQVINDPAACVMFHDQAEQTPQVAMDIAYGTGYSQLSGGTGTTSPIDSGAYWGLSTNYVRKGLRSYRFHVTKDTTYPPCCNWVASQAIWLSPSQQVIGNAWKYGAVSTLLPPSFQFESRPTVVAYNTLGPGDLQPGFQLVTMNGGFYVDGYFVGGPVYIGPVVRGQWDDWLVIRNWTSADTGSIILRRNGVQVYQKTGANWFSRVGDPAVGRVAHGLFKPAWATASGGSYGTGTPANAVSTPIDIYVDEVKFGSSCADINDFIIGGSAPLPVGNRILVFSKTAGYRHSSIAFGQSMFSTIGTSLGVGVTYTEDAAMFRLDTLQKFKAVIFLSTTGDILNGTQQTAFEQYIAGGGGFMGIHAATDTEYGWPWYGQLVGAWFSDHPAIQDAVVTRMNTTHPSTNTISNSWQRNDEWYNFGAWQSTVNPLLRVDESTYSGGTEGHPHYISWYHTFSGGRSWYTAMGHTDASYSETNFVDHVKGGLRWVMGEVYTPTAPVVSGETDKSVQLPATTTTLTATATDADGPILSYLWTKVSGPAGGTLTNTTLATVSVSALQAGLYTFRVAITDNTQTVRTDDINVNVAPAVVGADPPIASAGADQSITTSSTTLSSTGSIIYGGLKTRVWTKEVGGAATIVSPTAATTSVTGLVTGEYRFKVTITDSLDQVATDTVHVSVNIPLPNQLPVAYAGVNRTITLPVNSVTVSGASASDPDGSVVSTVWTKVSGTGGLITDASTLAPTFSGLAQGVYVYRLTVTDNRGGVSFSQMQVTVNPAIPPPNQPPVAVANPDNQMTTLPKDSVQITANVYDQDATGYVALATWTQVSGPKPVTITSGQLLGTQISTKITGLTTIGQYTFRINVTDNLGLYAYDDATVIVVQADVPPPVNQAPTVSAGPDKQQQYPDTVVTLFGTLWDLEDSANVTSRWRKVSGPVGGVTLSDTTKSFLELTFLVPGIYTFELKGTDPDGTVTVDQVTVQMTAAARKKRLLLKHIKKT